jgi:hypothetical protein
MHNTQNSQSVPVANSVAAASWHVSAGSLTAQVLREDVRPGIFYSAVNMDDLTSMPMLLSSREAKVAGDNLVLFVFEDEALEFQEKTLEAQRKH